MTDLEYAVAEAVTYNRIGALDKRILEYIASKNDVDPKEILEKIGWGRDYYD